MARSRREQLEEIDSPVWPVCPVTWQRCCHLVRLHLDTSRTLPTTAGKVIRQGEDFGRWVATRRHGWDQLTGVQPWMCEQVIGIGTADEGEKPKACTSRADRWAMRYAAQYFEREGHLTLRTGRSPERGSTPPALRPVPRRRQPSGQRFSPLPAQPHASRSRGVHKATGRTRVPVRPVALQIPPTGSGIRCSGRAARAVHALTTVPGPDGLGAG